MGVRDGDELAGVIGELLVAREARVAVVETTAGGLIAARMLSVPGASRWFDRGVVAYSAAAKRSLGVDVEVLREHGAVSVEVVEEMARALRELAGVAYSVAESGLSGPIQGRSPKPIGTVAIAVAGPGGPVSEETRFDGSRVTIMEQIAERALVMLRGVIEADAPAG